MSKDIKSENIGSKETVSNKERIQKHCILYKAMQHGIEIISREVRIGNIPQVEHASLLSNKADEMYHI